MKWQWVVELPGASMAVQEVIARVATAAQSPPEAWPPVRGSSVTREKW